MLSILHAYSGLPDLVRKKLIELKVERTQLSMLEDLGNCAIETRAKNNLQNILETNLKHYTGEM
jgi:hypothetical protein